MSSGDFSRRALLRAGGVAAAGAAMGMLPGVAFADPPGGPGRAPLRRGGVAGRGPEGGMPRVAASPVHEGGAGSPARTRPEALNLAVPVCYGLPVVVPRGDREIDVGSSYDNPPVPAGTRGN